MTDFEKKLLKLSADLLDEASSSFSNNTCNDYQLPDGFTDKDKLKLEHLASKWNNSEYDPDNELMGTDFIVMRVMASELRRMALNDRIRKSN